jgi:hypothetical protein
VSFGARLDSLLVHILLFFSASAWLFICGWFFGVFVIGCVFCWFDMLDFWCFVGCFGLILLWVVFFVGFLV